MKDTTQPLLRPLSLTYRRIKLSLSKILHGAEASGGSDRCGFGWPRFS